MESAEVSVKKYQRLSMLESVFAYTGSILAVRPWDEPGVAEIDLHLPGTDMRHWTESMHIKCKVGSLSYRDYSPAFWDAETYTCSLLLDTSHEGMGADWAGKIQAGDPVHYLKIGSSHQSLPGKGRAVLLGDPSAAGHFAGMIQLAPPRVEITGCIEWNSVAHCREFSHYFPKLPLGAIPALDLPADALRSWMQHFQDRPEDMYFLAGGVKLVSRLRSWLKERGVPGKRINAQGFWR